MDDLDDADADADTDVDAEASRLLKELPADGRSPR
jgi:hypothetical protein